MRPTRLLLALLLAATAACGTAAAPTTTTSTRSADLSDPAVQALLGAPPPDGFAWQRTAENLTIVGFTAAADPREIDAVGGALADLPPALLGRATPRLLVRTSDFASSEELQQAVTVSVGPDILLLDRTFLRNNEFITRIDLGYALAHELAHVAQWFELRPEYVGEVIDLGTTVKLAEGSRLVDEYAAATGWRREGSDWFLSGGSPPTPYAGTSPVEDQAEVIALAAQGRTNWLDPARLNWVMEWLDVTAEELESSRPWVPVGATELAPITPLYNQQVAEALAAGRNHIEPMYLAIGRTPADLADMTRRELESRDFVGSLGEVEAGKQYRGEFETASGITYLVEINEAPTGEAFETLLTYVAIW